MQQGNIHTLSSRRKLIITNQLTHLHSPPDFGNLNLEMKDCYQRSALFAFLIQFRSSSAMHSQLGELAHLLGAASSSCSSLPRRRLLLLFLLLLLLSDLNAPDRWSILANCHRARRPLPGPDRWKQLFQPLLPHHQFKFVNRVSSG